MAVRAIVGLTFLVAILIAVVPLPDVRSSLSPLLVVLGLLYGALAVDAEDATNYLVFVVAAGAAANSDVLAFLPAVGTTLNAIIEGVTTSLYASVASILVVRATHSDQGRYRHMTRRQGRGASIPWVVKLAAAVVVLAALTLLAAPVGYRLGVLPLRDRAAERAAVGCVRRRRGRRRVGPGARISACQAEGRPPRRLGGPAVPGARRRDVLDSGRLPRRTRQAAHSRHLDRHRGSAAVRRGGAAEHARPDGLRRRGDCGAAARGVSGPPAGPAPTSRRPTRSNVRSRQCTGCAGSSWRPTSPRDGSRRPTPTFWFGFKDDVVIRVRPAGGGSRIDVRSLSRVGGGDAGTNRRPHPRVRRRR